MNIKYIKTTDNKKYDLRDKRITDTDTGVATQSANGLLSSTDKKKLDGIASGAEVNQNAFSNIKIGNTTIVADGKTDTVELTAGNNIAITPDATNDKITIAATDTNTTYTFAGGTNQFTVTPSNGTAQTVSVTPSIANNVTGSNLTANTIILGNGNSGVKKSGKTIVTTLGSDDTTLPTSKAVKDAIDALPEPMIFKGTLGTGGTITSLPAAASGNNGFTYKVITAGTYASQSAKAGDVFISNGNSWNLIPSGDEPSGTVTNIATGTGLTGGPITSSGTISHADTSSQASVSNSGRTYIQSITLDSMGHVTGIASATETVVNTDEKVKQRLDAGNANRPLLFSRVTTEQTATDSIDMVYRNNSIYANPSTGTITANKFNGSSTHADTSSQSGFVENYCDNLEHYWMKLWEIDVNDRYVDRDVTFLLQSAYQEMQGTLHVKIRQNGDGDFRISMRLTSGNIIKNRVRLYYNSSTGNCQLWYDCEKQHGCVNAKMLHKTFRYSNEVSTLGTMYSTATAEQQTLPGTGYQYVEPTYAVYAEWNNIQNKPSSYPVRIQQDISTNVNYPLVWTTSASDANGPQSALYKSFNKLLYNPSRSWLRSGTLELYPQEELPHATGIRIHSTPSGVASLMFCGTDNTGISGTSANSWFFGTSNGNIYLNRNGANGASKYRLWGHSNGYTIGNTTESGYNFTVGGTSRFIGTTTTSHILPASDYTYNIGSNATEYANVFSRAVFARHLNASAPYSNDKDLYLGYQSTTNILFYVTDSVGNNRKRVAQFKQDGNATFDYTVTAASFVGPLSGNASSASKLTTNAGGATQPVYFSEGVPTACSYQLNKTVPSNAVFTDTHYTTHLYAGSGTAANAATTNGNTKLTVVDNTTPRESVTIKGTGGTTVSSDANGVVTINSTDASSKQFTFPYPVKEDDSYYFIISPKGNATITPDSTCYFVEITALINNGTDSFVTRSAKFMTHCYWFTQNSGLRITNPVYNTRYTSNCPILYHDKAQGADVGTETYNHNVCNIPFKLTIETGLMSVNIRVEGPDVSECTCSRSYTSFKWPAVEPDWSIV